MPDVNGSSFHLLLTGHDWLERAGPTGAPPIVTGGDVADLEWTRTCGLRLRRTVPFDRTGSPVRFGPEDRRGADHDLDGTIWHVGDDRTSLWRSRDSDAEHFWPAPPAVVDSTFTPCIPATDEPPILGGVAATEDRWLVVGLLTEPGPGLMILDLVRTGEPVVRDWSALVPDFHPIDACRRPDGGVLVLDAERGRGEPTRVWPLDRRADPILLEAAVVSEPIFDVCAPDVDPDTDPGFTSGQPRPWVLPVDGAISIEAIDQSSYLILDDVSQRVLRFEGETLLDSLDLSDALASRLTDPAGDPAIRGHDLAVLRDSDDRRILYVSDAGGDEVFAFDIDAGFVALAERYPMRRHHGRGLIAGGDRVWFDTRTRWHPLVTRGRSRYRTSGTVVTAAFDGHERSCRWHRVAIDGRIPDGTTVRVESRAADELAELGATTWHVEPAPYLRRGGTELPLDISIAPVARGDVGTWETLLQRTDGRYAQLRITLEGTGGSSPELAALRLIYPRFSYLHRYLPELYAERDAPTRFLERYLANPEGLLTDLEDRIADAHLLFDSRSTPSQYLDWLAASFGAGFDRDLDERRRRLFLANAVDMFARRGTVRGLVTALRLVLDDCPEKVFDDVDDLDGSDPFVIRIAERYQTRSSAAPLPDDPTSFGTTDDPAAIDPAIRWTAALGANELHHRFRNDLIDRYGADWSSTSPTTDAAPAWLHDRDADDITVRPTTPGDEGERADWTRFLGAQLGDADAAFTTGHLPLYRRFLLQRYERTERLAAAYGLGDVPESFAGVGPPERLEPFGPALEDWEAFVSLVIPIAESAHRFSVLLPVDVDAPERTQLQMLERARRVVAVEKPAHTIFDVRPYWAAFQLGDARLGIDTQLGAGARRAALVLDRDRLAHAALAGPAGHDAPCTCDQHAEQQSTTTPGHEGSRP